MKIASFIVRASGVLSVVMAGVLQGSLAQAAQGDYYRVEDIAAPPGVVPECGGLSFLPDGRLVAVFHHGEVYLYSPDTKQWRQFAEGLHDPMGVLAVSEREILVTQRPELTRLVDSDGDGKADRYECLSDAWGISGNYHEFVSGMARDEAGNLYVPISNGSNASVARYEVRGSFSPEGYVHSSHFSAVPYRGWVVKVSKDGSLTPVASGFRQPNGIALDPNGRLFVTDNQGDWIGTSKLHHVVPGRFYGHTPSLVWRSDYVPGRSINELDRLRTEGAVLFPHAILANSPGQPVWDRSGGKFGPFAGQMFLPEHNIPRILRVMLEEVSGEWQGAATTLSEGPPLRAGSHRLAFAPDGSLWVGQSERQQGWPAGAGIQRLVWTGKTPLDISEMHLTSDGFSLKFTQPIDTQTALAAEALNGRRYYYQYHEEYGSPQTDIHAVIARGAVVSSDRTSLTFAVDTLAPGYIYEFTFKGITGADGTPLAHRLICYTANRLLDGSRAPVPRPAPTGGQSGSGKDKSKLEEPD